MEQYPIWIQNGQLTPEAGQVFQYFEGVLKQYLRGPENPEPNLAGMNSLGGHIKYYHSLTRVSGKTQENIASEFPNLMRGGYDDLRYFEAEIKKAETIEKTAAQSNELTAALEVLRNELANVKAELTALKETAPAEPAKKRGRPKKVVETVEAEQPEAIEEEDDATEEPEADESEE